MVNPVAGKRFGGLSRAFLFALCLFGISSSATGQPGGGPDPHSRFSLISEFDALVPGATSFVGLLFEVDEGWHIYQESQNDTGLPPRAEWSATVAGREAGLEFGEVIWPAGHRFTQPGEILDHGYEGTVLLMVPIFVPESVAVGDEVEVLVDLEWLACDSMMCLPGYGEARLVLPVRASAAVGEQGELFASTRAELGRIVTGSAREEVSVRWEGRSLLIASSVGGPISFVPGPGSAQIEGLYSSGASESGGLRLGLAEGSDEISGWIWLEGEGIESDLWYVRSRVGESPLSTFEGGG